MIGVIISLSELNVDFFNYKEGGGYGLRGHYHIFVEFDLTKCY